MIDRFAICQPDLAVVRYSARGRWTSIPLSSHQSLLQPRCSFLEHQRPHRSRWVRIQGLAYSNTRIRALLRPRRHEASCCAVLAGMCCPLVHGMRTANSSQMEMQANSVSHVCFTKSLVPKHAQALSARPAWCRPAGMQHLGRRSLATPAAVLSEGYDPDEYEWHPDPDDYFHESFFRGSSGRRVTPLDGSLWWRPDASVQVCTIMESVNTCATRCEHLVFSLGR